MKQFLLPLLLLGFRLLGQNLPVPENTYSASVQNAIKIHKQYLGEQWRLYNGSQYAGHVVKFSDGSHPYFFSKDFSLGSVVYDGVLYSDVLLSFDEIMNVLLFKDETHHLQLINNKIERFSIFGKSFLNLKNGAESDFFEILNEGSVQVLKQEKKRIQEDLGFRNEGIERSVKAKILYYIKKDERITPIRKQKDLQELWGSQWASIQKTLNDKQLTFAKQPEATLLEAVKNEQ
jgi:hypothetical protein